MVVLGPCRASDPWIPLEVLVSRLVAHQAMPRGVTQCPHSVGEAGSQLLPPVLRAAVRVTAVTRVSALKTPTPFLRRRILRRTCRHPGRGKHLLPRCRYVPFSAGCAVSRVADVTGITRTPAHIATGAAARLPSSAPEPRFRLFFCVATTSDAPADIPDVVSLLFLAAGMSLFAFA
jgi:hypothetical protein